MKSTVSKNVSLGQAAAFLDGRYAGRCRDVSELGGGDWSRAYSFYLDDRALVVRFGAHGEDFAKDKAAMSFASTDLPVPSVLEIGTALDGFFAISERHFGTFLEALDEPGMQRVIPALLGALDALRSIPVPATASVEWPAEDPASHIGWRDWLVATLTDRGEGRVSGWRAQLAASADLNALFAAGEQALRSRLGCCPDIRHVLHVDLLNRNVLVSEDGSRLEAVFDWGCSAYGDFLYDVAWITFWAPWFAALDLTSFRKVIVRHYGSIGLDVPQFDERLTCYEIHIGLTHLAYCTFAGRDDERRAVARRLVSVLDTAAS